MRREDVTREQAEAIRKEIGPMLGYLNRLKDRMNKVFARDDSLFDEVIDAADALHRLNVSIHYLSCGQAAGHAFQPQVGFADAEPLLSPEPHDQP
jgi:hypothetical protein